MGPFVWLQAGGKRGTPWESSAKSQDVRPDLALLKDHYNKGKTTRTRKATNIWQTAGSALNHPTTFRLGTSRTPHILPKSVGIKTRASDSTHALPRR